MMSTENEQELIKQLNRGIARSTARISEALNREVQFLDDDETIAYAQGQRAAFKTILGWIKLLETNDGLS